MTTHSLFGLYLSSDRPIPGLPVVRSGHVDVTIRMGVLPEWAAGRPDAAATPWYVSPVRDSAGAAVLVAWHVGDGSYMRLAFSEGAEFVVDRAGTEIWARWREPLSIDDAASYLFGPVLGLLLRLRGVTCLHASAVAVDGRAVAFAGPEGAGKSTLAAAFATLGDAVLADDLVALRVQRDECMVQPGLPWLRLRDGADDLLQPRGPLPRLVPTADDGFVDLDLRHPGLRHETRAVPLGALYLIGERVSGEAAPCIDAIGRADAVTRLAAQTWATRLLDAHMRTQEFDTLCWIAQHVPIRRIRAGTNAAGLERLVQMIQDDLAAMIVGSPAS